MRVSRRTFMRTASGTVGVALFDWTSLATSPPDLEKVFTEIRANLLEMVNEERAVEKVPLVAMDELATQVATKHAIAMATGEFASHWGRDGLKPYQRYSFAGGTHATAENISAADNTWSMKVEDLKQDAAYLHLRLYQQKPPHDGHRRTILAPQHTHVGFGLAVEQLRLRLVELFVAKHVEIGEINRKAKPGDQVILSGRVMNPEHLLSYIEVLYEPLPNVPELSWLKQARPYSLPNESFLLRPKIPPPYKYADGSGSGIVEIFPDGTFTTPITFFRTEPGIYTIVAWIKTNKTAKAFPATEVCVKAE